MYKHFLAFSILVSACAFGMQKDGSELPLEKLLAIVRITVITQAVAEELYKELAIVPSSKATPAKLATQVGEEAANSAKHGIALTDMDIKVIIGDALKRQFKSVSRERINLMVSNEMDALKDGNTRKK